MTTNEQVICAIADCGKPRYARGWCQPHYGKWHRHGDPLGGQPAVPVDPITRYWSHVDVRGPDECWPWTGGLGNGYGHIWINGRSRPAHQIAWEIANDQAFPPGWVADHTCHNADLSCPGGRQMCLHRRCQNPAHIDAVLSEENSSRGQRGRKHPTSGRSR